MAPAIRPACDLAPPHPHGLEDARRRKDAADDTNMAGTAMTVNLPYERRRCDGFLP